jgi:hypothetical protein
MLLMCAFRIRGGDHGSPELVKLAAIGGHQIAAKTG